MRPYGPDVPAILARHGVPETGPGLADAQRARGWHGDPFRTRLRDGPPFRLVLLDGEGGEAGAGEGGTLWQAYAAAVADALFRTEAV